MLTGRKSRVLVALFAGAFLTACGADAPSNPPKRGETRTLVSRTSVYPYPKAASVRLFVASAVRTPSGFIDENGRPLTDAQRAAFESTLSISSWRTGTNDAASPCFVPHHFFRYYDAAGRMVGEIAICFCCTGIRAEPVLPQRVAAGADFAALDFDVALVGEVVRALGYDTQVNCD